uniref:Uncharacterized protein n=1 Tax=virus sp. ctML55 TaxID=2827627 RepID=A0A8S5RII6_9VIRU|nr:MAG TPA: hypothetical protein [virus sp. ctML55]
MYLKKRWIKYLMYSLLGDVSFITRAINQLCKIYREAICLPIFVYDYE